MKKIVTRVSESLTVRIFLITALILAVSCGATYAFLAWATPISYISVISDELDDRTSDLIKELEQSTLENCGPVIERFISQTGASVSIAGENGTKLKLPVSVETGYAKDYDVIFNEGVSQEGKTGSAVGVDAYVVSDSGDGDSEGAVAPADSGSSVDSVMIETSVISVRSASTSYPFSFRDDDTVYNLQVSSMVQTVNQATEAMGRVLPYLILVVLAISLLGAVLYSWSITRPIVRISRISQKMADLDFTWSCEESRRDEIGRLGRNLNALSERLSGALTELQNANTALQHDIDRERELEQQRIAFFSAASHELKTPITILKGQLSGMLAGIDVYKDRDKYLAKSLAATNRMEGLVQEILTVSRIEQADIIHRRTESACPQGMNYGVPSDISACPQDQNHGVSPGLRQVPVDLSAMMNGLTEFLRDLTDQRNQTLTADIEPDQMISGDPTLLERAAANLLSNASLHSPEGAGIKVRLAAGTDGPVLTVINSDSHIPEEDLPHLFEAFYRVDASRSRATGGSGLGLYLVKIILDRHGADCRIENKDGCVQVSVTFKT